MAGREEQTKMMEPDEFAENLREQLELAREISEYWNSEDPSARGVLESIAIRASMLAYLIIDHDRKKYLQEK